jgi:tetratricopeptide (TPR) repeat protein
MLLVATVRASPHGDERMLRAPTAAGNRNIGQALLGDVRDVVLAPLSADEAHDLAAALLRRTAHAATGGAGRGPGASETAEAIAREAAGHPFFIDALVRHAALGGSVGGARLEDALWQSVTRLEPTARRIVEILAVAASPVSQEVLATAAEVPPDTYGRHLARLRVGHLISVTGARASDTAEPYHDRVRAALLAHLDDEARAQLHGALARALETTGSRDVEALAMHWRGARDADRAAAYAMQAADAAANALAFDRAAKLYESALELERREGAERSALLEKLGDAFANAGRGKRAAQAYAEAARSAHTARSLDLQRRGADQLLRAGHFDEGLAAIARVLAAMNLALPRSPASALVLFVLYRLYLRMRGLRFRARDVSEILATDLTRIDVCHSLSFGLGLIDNLQGAAFQARNLILALRSGERSRIARAIAIEAVYASRSGGPAVRRTEALMERAHALAAESREPHVIAWTHGTSGVAHYLLGRFKRALGDLERSKAAWSELKTVGWELDTVEIFSTSALVQLGQLSRVALETPKALREARQRGDLFAAVNLRIGLPNVAWLAVDDAEAALAQIDEAMSEWSKRGFHLEH